MDETSRYKDILAAFQSGRLELCLSLIAPLLQEQDIPAQILLITAQCYIRLGHEREAAMFYERAADKLPDNASTLFTIAAQIKVRLKDDASALALLRQVQARGPLTSEQLYMLRRLLRGKLALLEMEQLDAFVHRGMLAGDQAAFDSDDPFFHLMWCLDEKLNAKVTHMPSGHAFTPESRAQRRRMPHHFGEKIRVGYLSSDVSDQHATMILFQGVLEAHNADKFDVTLFCMTDEGIAGTDQGFRQRYPNIVDIHSLDDEEARERIRAREIDILVDLKGHTRGARVDLINSGLAPIQVSYLGFPGTGIGIDCDYIIGDPIVLQDGSQEFYHEAFCRLPECYQANDRWFRPLPEPLSRSELGLPEDKFIFASFNDIRKITADVARAWAAILRGASDSVLWMLCRDETARDNFKMFMQGEGIETDRIIYCGRVDYEPHIARIQAADLALDTFPYTGHTTTSDSLWAGLPLIALKGRNFSSRVSESLLRAIGLPELVMATPGDFVSEALRLAGDREALQSICERLKSNRLTTSLFDTERFTRHLERAYEMMVYRAKEGLAPEMMDIPALQS